MYAKFFKRFFDFWLSLTALLCLSPVLLILTVIGAIAMRGNPFFTQLRPGKISKKTGKEKIFKLVKFRTMSNARDKEGNLLPDAKRLNTYGKLLRSTSLDELPELFNILVGHMSIVGPRPLTVGYLEFYNETERQRHLVRPGLTGLAQVNGRTALNWGKRLAYDVEYVQRVSLWLDIKIIFKTVLKVFARADVVAAEEQGDFSDYRKKQLEKGREEHEQLKG
ncbi:MAG: sugar transferase [Ruminococcaceae bacterium]|nr:sugar transferase [Oscillospiraceae bacterium]